MTRRALADCRAIVTGASSGIGRELVLELARHKCRVVATARREDRLQLLAQEAETVAGAAGLVHVIAGDITSDETRRALVAKARALWGGLDLLINNAGAGIIRDFEQSEPEHLRQVMEVNFFAAVELIRAAMPALRAGKNPLVVNVASILGHRGIPHYSEYCASKFALVGFSQALRAEMAGQNLDVLVVSPGTTQTEFFDSLVAEQRGVGSRGEGGVTPRSVAKATVRAIQSGSHWIIPNRQGRGLVWLDRMFPRLADALVARFG